MATSLIENVSDTSLWIAACRAQESQRPDALFVDPLASRLAGKKGLEIASRIEASAFTAWAIAIRTCIIDGYINEMIGEGIDTVLNLGAGLDTRPYRLELPSRLRWVEVDYPRVLAFKEAAIDDERPHCQLERVGLDLADQPERAKLFSRISSESSKVLVISEGLLLYLKEEQVASLAENLRARKSFRFWIADFYVPEMLRLMRIGIRFRRSLKNAPIQFFPKDWFEFFRQHGWGVEERLYYAEESKRLGRAIPRPALGKILRAVLPKRKRAALGNFGGYALYTQTPA